MNTLIFSILWTVLSAIGVIVFYYEGVFADEPLFFRILFSLFPLVGLLFIWDSARRYRRFKSVRREMTEAGEVFVWTERDGTERRDTTDPRIKWDAEDRDFSG